MNKNLLKMVAIIAVIIGVLMLISWVFSGDSSNSQKREFNKRVQTEQTKMQQKIER